MDLAYFSISAEPCPFVEASGPVVGGKDVERQERVPAAPRPSFGMFEQRAADARPFGARVVASHRNVGVARPEEVDRLEDVKATDGHACRVRRRHRRRPATRLARLPSSRARQPSRCRPAGARAAGRTRPPPDELDEHGLVSRRGGPDGMVPSEAFDILSFDHEGGDTRHQPIEAATRCRCHCTSVTY